MVVRRQCYREVNCIRGRSLLAAQATRQTRGGLKRAFADTKYSEWWTDRSMCVEHAAAVAGLVLVDLS